MVSKAFYQQSRVPPRLIQHLRLNEISSVEIWITTCIVTNFGKAANSKKGDAQESCSWSLINPSNPALTGCSNFPYFPRGGPVPKENVRSMHKDWQPLGFVSTWGGMEVGTGMLFPVSVVDGLVHQRGGWQLQAELQWKRLTCPDQEQLCPIGSAVTTTAAGALSEQYDTIVHTTPPFYQHDDDVHDHPETHLLARCYESALSQALYPSDENLHHQQPKHHILATPLLGAGCRGFPVTTACSVAAEAVVPWLRANAQHHPTPHNQVTLAFGLLEESVAVQLMEALDRAAAAAGAEEAPAPSNSG